MRLKRAEASARGLGKPSMRHAGIDLVNRLGAAKVADVIARFEWGALSPGTLPNGLPMVLALVPPIAAGLVIFRLAALEILAITLTAALAAVIVQRLIHLRPEIPLVLPPLFAVAFVGAAANLLWVSGIAVAAGALEVLRARFLPSLRVNTGMLAYVGALLAGSGAIAAYLRPGDLIHSGPEP